MLMLGVASHQLLCKSTQVTHFLGQYPTDKYWMHACKWDVGNTPVKGNVF